MEDKQLIDSVREAEQALHGTVLLIQDEMISQGELCSQPDEVGVLLDVYAKLIAIRNWVETKDKRNEH